MNVGNQTYCSIDWNLFTFHKLTIEFSKNLFKIRNQNKQIMITNFDQTLGKLWLTSGFTCLGTILGFFEKKSELRKCEPMYLSK